MKFGAVPIDEAEGAVMAHGVRIDGFALKKGEIVTPERLRTLAAAGVSNVVAARLQDGDVVGDGAARRLARRLAGPSPSCPTAFTGRVNMVAQAPTLPLLHPPPL